MIAGVVSPLPEITDWNNWIDELAIKGYAIADGFLSISEAATLRGEVMQRYAEGELSRARTGSGPNIRIVENVRGDHIQWVEPSNLDFPYFFERVTAVMDLIRTTCFVPVHYSEMHFAVYPVGAYYKRHLDVFAAHKSRKISMVCYLPEYGGQLRMYLPDETGAESHLDIDPIAGRLVVFRSELMEHEVLPALRERCSITGWFSDTDPWLRTVLR